MNKGIICKHVSKVYKSGERQIYALKDADFSLPEGKFVIVLGPSGAGKSTLLNLLGGMDHATRGEIFVDDQPLHQMNDEEMSHYRANYVGFIFQFYNLIPTLSVYENVSLIQDLKKDTLDVMEVLNWIGLSKHANKFPSQLSGGEQQRVSIARALCKNARMLLCDEPTGALDSETGASILKLLQKTCHEKNCTTIVVTHNANIAQMADVILYVKNGKIESIQEQICPKMADEVNW